MYERLTNDLSWMFSRLLQNSAGSAGRGRPTRESIAQVFDSTESSPGVLRTRCDTKSWMDFFNILLGDFANFQRVDQECWCAVTMVCALLATGRQ